MAHQFLLSTSQFLEDMVFLVLLQMTLTTTIIVTTLIDALDSIMLNVQMSIANSGVTGIGMSIPFSVPIAGLIQLYAAHSNIVPSFEKKAGLHFSIRGVTDKVSSSRKIMLKTWLNLIFFK